MSSHHDEYMDTESGGAMEAEAREESRGLVTFDDDSEEAKVTCRTGSSLAAEPDIISNKLLTVQGSRTAVLDLRLGSKVTFNPGVPPQLCSISPDDAQLLPGRYVNLSDAIRVVQLPGRLLFQLDFQDGQRPGTLAFRLKFEEQRIQPKRAVILATVDLVARTVMIARG
ncbi:hypothetical protein JY651_07200 [Pyxidicoccus parkwayensis]|uniref:Uncharacterized protein n=1 Tax=Pyxidicoccus parkwayensis TaxID=2813578 RepID=A0ABX7P0U2_9BACT|nr:hypothetical protein [Pyxidicoccus parkwaysis]QSQ24725.1 hypothetical protein JY651_07200 [Pyxidicoccus parkwaysis]